MPEYDVTSQLVIFDFKPIYCTQHFLYSLSLTLYSLSLTHYSLSLTHQSHSLLTQSIHSIFTYFEDVINLAFNFSSCIA